MTYLGVRWHHTDDAYPVLLYSELDDARMELRKVEVYSDGRRGWAGSGSASGAALGTVPVPSVQTIASDPQFSPTVITAEEFEQEWMLAIDGPS